MIVLVINGSEGDWSGVMFDRFSLESGANVRRIEVMARHLVVGVAGEEAFSCVEVIVFMIEEWA
jgi:hypothetical protein